MSAGSADHLALALEAFRREDVGEGMADEGGPDGLGDFPGARLLSGGVAVDRRAASGVRELVGGFAQDNVDARVGRADEGGEEFGRGGRTAPVGRRKEVDLHAGFGERLVGDIDANEESRRAGRR